MTAGETIRGLLELTRPVNVLAASVLTFIGAFVAGGVGSYPLQTGAAVAATGLAVGAGNAINDYFDREIDRINQPGRAIPRGAVSPRGALVFSIVLFAAAVGLALTLPLEALAIAGINLVALVAYTEYFKGLPGLGNALVAYLVGSTFLFGAAAVGEIGPAVVLFALAAIATLTREIIKDVEDIEGDREEGLNTLPIAIGERQSLYIATILLVIGVAASPLPYVLGYFELEYLLVVLPANAIMIVAVYESFEDPTIGQTHLKYGTFLAALAFIVGRAALEVNVL
ncbi:(S)-2,3-di-O-geranylgeranylglyceryl phosphate synthase [Natrialba magadii ATCC 43099]|uniref:Digeranylgeranylglyceryl phosphate synthase n=1 Tax=Natrialba magadii (strain ATCC 43099 / DSM 3394 / CCM 3739 / CIP 104546 / IAM 13178 / JCM 8861 / NBRC 102185 / NCIMB 2190 / MS3) TaxID=547559 RepID=D3SRW8_NATMM|nr:geranylgeranylglycerol-phosphate geranylgeranyltransferase [Natrialba magadii]ADD06742.1 (S)-2,3-di-O-geranylgeranylglyceryl phosphate synthase [Natrialba magadii ATCC 43099]ELY27822.1 prenyltransferase [Natrialba magadii ATCC 43099]